MLRALIPAASRLVTAAAVVCFVGMLPFLSGQDPAAAVLRARSAEQLMTQEALDAVRRGLGLGETAWQTLGLWFGRLLHGDLGTSWVSGAPVGPSVLSALGVSLLLMGVAILVALAVAGLVCLGPVRAGMRGRPATGSGALSAALTALPEFLLGAVLLVVLSVWLGLLPPYGWGTPSNVVLPALAMGLPAGGLLGRLLAEAITSAYREPWVQTWIMSGWTRGEVLRGTLRRAVPPVLPQIGLVMVGLTGGAVAVEQIFTVPGLGRTALGAAASSDLPMLQACVLVLLAIGVLAGSGSRLLGRRLLGPAMAAQAMTEGQRAPVLRRGWWIVPAACGVVLLGVIVLGVPLDAYGTGLPRLAAPGTEGASGVAVLGADASGRDVLARVGHGALATILLALACVLFCWVIGLLAGTVPALSTGPFEAANAVPPVLAGMVVAALMGPSAQGAVIAVLAVSWAPLAAHTASLVEEANATAYSRMAPLLGISRTRLVLTKLLPGVSGPVFRHAMLRLPGTALALAALGFLGLGPQPPTPDWGLLLNEGIDYIERAPWVAAAPMLALIALSVLAVSLSSRRA
ncbi:ABC transporter permease subunit [Rothia halotolerans]|uniref:ABC transporter permease subunit n=1 Tax=Rothia halotolerans TaxID=405770 RepID=UPI00101BDE11|nr:ABC transporter permease subunit [Rothia halotolerans]